MNKEEFIKKVKYHLINDYWCNEKIAELKYKNSILCMFMENDQYSVEKEHYLNNCDPKKEACLIFNNVILSK